MKTQTTQKAIKNRYTNIIKVGYCNLQFLFKALNQSPNYYTARAEGWAADIYHINNNTVIVTGYAPFGNIKPLYDTVKKYDEKARQLLTNGKYKKSSTIQKHAKILLDAFIAEVLKEV